jgi:hypothetical protein
MAAVERLSIDGETVSDSPEWAEIEETLSELEDGKAATMGLHLGEDAFAITATVPGLGFFLTVRQGDDVTEMQLVRPGGDEALVEATIAGNRERHPRFTFVPRDLAVEALKEFHGSGRRKADLSWMDPLDISRHYLQRPT